MLLISHRILKMLLAKPRIKQNSNKFQDLHFNLKNEIFNFLNLKEIIFEISFINKKIFTKIRNIQIYCKILYDKERLIKDIDFYEENIFNLQKEFYIYEENKEILDEICVFLNYLKYKIQKNLNLKQNKINFKILFNFFKLI